MHTITLGHPSYWFYLIPVALFFWAATRRSNAPLAADQVRQSLILRIIGAALVIAALAAPVLHRTTRDQAVLFLLDVSRSIPPAARAAEFDLARRAVAAKPGGDQAGVVTFAQSAQIDTPPSRNAHVPSDHVGMNDEATDIGAAIRAAAGSGGNGPAQIVLLTDGNQTAGSALQAASAAGAPVSAVDPAQFLGNAPPEASVVRVDLPVGVHDNEPVTARVLIASTIAQTGQVTLKVDGKSVYTARAALNAGKTLITVPLTLRGSGLRGVEADLSASKDTLLENDSASATVQVIGAPRILYVTDHSEQISPTLQRALHSQSIDLDLVSAAQAPRDLASFASYDEVVLSNISADELTSDQQTSLQSAVRDFGTGLGMVGGVNSYIGGGWKDTPIEAALPVEMKPRVDKKLPAADIVVVLDASSSMSEEENGIEKVQLAARAAVSLLGTLQATDRVAVIAVTTEATVVLPFTTPAHALAAKGDIEGVGADGGGIYCLTGLQAAYGLLDSSTAPIKHVILCADTSDSEEQDHCVELARNVRADSNITTSCCGIGDWGDSDVAFQKEVADAGGGQLFVVSQATNLPQFFQRDLGHYQAPPFLEGTFIPRLTSGDKALGGLASVSEPPLLGYNVVTPRANATVAMRAPSQSDPIFAYGSYGLGRTFAFTSDETDHWAAKWLAWAGYGKFWAQALRWSLRRNRPATFQAFTDVDPSMAQGHVTVDAFSADGSYVNGAAFSAMIAGPDGKTRRLPLTQSAPGRYQGNFDASGVGSYFMIVARDGAPQDGQALLAASQPYAAEYAQTGPNLPLLKQIASATGGEILDDPAKIWSMQPGGERSSLPVATLCLLLATLVFVADIAWRRLGLRVRPKVIARQVAAAVGTAARVSEDAVVAMQARAASVKEQSRPEAKAAQKEAAIMANADNVLNRRVGGRASTSDESDNAFPLVVSLDEMRRRERARDQEKDR